MLLTEARAKGLAAGSTATGLRTEAVGHAGGATRAATGAHAGAAAEADYRWVFNLIRRLIRNGGAGEKNGADCCRYYEFDIHFNLLSLG
ncbi:hypothetical protein TPL01_27850 [Sulfuriferula plumbiphila]|uniref:Uncharacterized protein n=1 Tax=Sulfuriferula plumbiphila TaxID=171865 RepID=A0A512LAZ6_9PROT|nr:hypothetical protein [Sulfuriferula plumbiphila]BBP03931.1 hypothetical protein SFPGR_13530 [Sulfuriferula plumbiphila]GEP31647.1 hypothetical protein TPL01_27850 [Sulfuriferula plumbiphila]